MSNVPAGPTSSEVVRLPPPAGLTQLPPVRILDETAASDDQAQVLKSLLDRGHATVAPLRKPKLILHSHLPHLLGSAYFLGGNKEQLEELYEHEIQTLVPIDDTFIRGEAITKDNWRDFLGQKEYTVAYVEFFDQEIKQHNGDWKEVMRQYLFTGSQPLVNGCIGGLAHPFIHLAYAWELQSPAVATEALSLACTEYIGLHGLLDQSPQDNSTYKNSSLAEVVKRVHDDHRFDGLFEHQGITNMEILLRNRYDVLLEHWNAWEVTDPLHQLEQLCDLSVLLAIGTGDQVKKFDFFLVHAMTTAHALRVLWPLFPEDQRGCILRQYALFVIMTYICQKRPTSHEGIIEVIEGVPLLDSMTWDTAVKQAWDHRWFKDSHFFKVVRAPKVFEETFGEKGGFYRKAAAKFLAEFDGWEGFGLGVEGFLPNRDGYIPE